VVHVVGSFSQTLAQATPATATTGNTANANARRLAAIGAAVVGDSIWHWWYIPASKGHGLRGGVFHVNGDGPEFELVFNNVRWTTDVTVDGTGTWNQDTGRVTASLQITGPGGLTGTVDVVYDDYTPGPPRSPARRAARRSPPPYLRRSSADAVAAIPPAGSRP